MRMTGGLEVLKGADLAPAQDPGSPRFGGLGPAGTRLKETKEPKAVQSTQWLAYSRQHFLRVMTHASVGGDF